MTTEIVERRFEIDTKGFATQMSEMKLWRLIQEIISNSFDEKPVTVISCDIHENKKHQVVVEIVDNGNGFRDEKDIYTLFKDSYKRVNKNQRGRYNLGEKQFFARAVSGWVKTRKTFIEFQEDTRKVSEIPDFKGAQVHAVFDLEEDESLGETITLVEKVAVPNGKQLSINGTKVDAKTLVKKFKTRLPTVIAQGANKKMVRRVEDTEVFIYEKDSQEKPIIYELGCMVQEMKQDLKWHVDVQQKIPQTTERSVISDAYLQKLYATITENTIDLIDSESSGANWISDALKGTNAKTSEQILEKRYGTKDVMVKSSNYRDNERALEAGVHLVRSGELDSSVVSNLKEQGTLKYASQEFSSDGWETAKHVEPTPEMEHFAKICIAVAKDVIGKTITVSFVTTKHTREIADYGGTHLRWNVRLCGGKKFFNNFGVKPIGVLVHELAHDKLGNNDGDAHFSHEYLREMERIAGEIGVKGIQHWIVQC